MSEEEFNDYMEDIDTIIDNYKKENKKLKEEIERLNKIIQEKDKEISFLKASIKVFTDKWNI